MNTLDSLKAKCREVQTSGQMMFCVCQVLGTDWVTCDHAGGGMSITSDGFVVSGSLFIGSADDLERNLRGFLNAAEVNEDERTLFGAMYSQKVHDWRKYAPATL